MSLYTNAYVVAKGNLYSWSSPFSNPVINASYQVGDYIIVMCMLNGALTNYNPTGFTRIGVHTSGLPLFYQKMKTSGSNLTVWGLSGQGDVRYIIVRGAGSVSMTGQTDGNAKTISTREKYGFVVITTGNSNSSQFRGAGYSVLPSTNWPDRDFYTMAWKQTIDNFYVPPHSLWSTFENYIVLSTLYTSWVTSTSINQNQVLAGEDIKFSWTANNESSIENSLYDIEVYLGSSWVRIASDINQNVYSYTYKIPKTSRKNDTSRFRIRSKSIDGSYVHPWVESSPFIVDRYRSVIKSNDKMYTYKGGTWIEVSGTQTKDWFYQNGMGELSQIPEAEWGELVEPISIVSFTNSEHIPIVDVTVPIYKPIYKLNELHEDIIVKSDAPMNSEAKLKRIANPMGQLIIQKEDIIIHAPTIPKSIKKVTFRGLTTGTSTNGRKIIFSIDGGISYYTRLNSQWIVLNGISNDDTSKEVVKTQGMTFEDVENLSEVDWFEIFGEEPRVIRFAYYLEMDLFNNQFSIDEVEFLMEATGSWRKLKRADYTYGYPNDHTLQVELFKDGYYKINY